MVTLDAADPVGPALREAFSAALAEFLSDRAAALADISPTLAPLVERARLFTRGGKRLRPAFCVWGYAACGGDPARLDAVVRAAASLDLLHVSALVHDDVMDASDTRRGLPAAHKQFEADHVAAGLRGDSAAFGRAGAILLGDLLLVWSAEMMRRAGLDRDALDRALPHADDVRTEVTAGQFLDIEAQAEDPYLASRTPEGRERLAGLIRTVVTYKSASYTVRRPLAIGAALAGSTHGQQEALREYGEPLGRAFQYRDDVLGVFGDEQLTGKQSGEDLREGKLTLLVAETFAAADRSAAGELAALFGSPDLGEDDVARARAIITDSGALARVEAEIAREYGNALAALEGTDLTTPGRAGLQALARSAVSRRF